MAKLTPKEKMEIETVNLIRTVTNIDEDEENFEICERFCLSNLLYHKFLDPDENKINRVLSGLEQKFRVHAQPEKANCLKALVSKYKSQEVWDEYHEQHDIRYRLLSCLLQISATSLREEFSPPETSPEEENMRINWREVLKEGERTPDALGSESDLSVWSDDEEEGTRGKSEELTSDPLHSDEDSRIPVSSDSGQKRVDPAKWLSDNLQSRYWETAQMVRVESGERSANIAEITETLGAELSQEMAAMVISDPGTRLGARTDKVTEYQVLRELLWMLVNPVTSALFNKVSGEFVVRPGITIPSLTEAAFRRMLGEVLSVINNVSQLRTFLREVEADTHITRTFEAYGESVSLILEAFSYQVLKIETIVKKQEETKTMIDVIESLQPWFKMIDSFKRLHDKASSEWKTNQNWLKSVKLLSVLYNGISSNHLPRLHPYIVDTFLRTFRPYLSIIHVWLEEGRLEDWRQEFIFHKESKSEDGDEDRFWHNALLTRPYREKMALEKIAPLRIFDNLENKVFVSGKSIEILSRLDRGNNVDSDHLVKSTGLFDAFIKALKERLPSVIKGENNEVGEASKPQDLDPELQSIVDSSDDPFIALAFKDIFMSAQQVKCHAVDDEWKPSFLLDPYELDILLPLESAMVRSLTPIIERQYSSACTSLVTMFMQELDLEAVLSRARKVFFMEAGDLMHDFCSQLFTSLGTRDSLEVGDSASLSLLLQDCLGGRYPGWCDLFSCSYSPPDSGVASLADLSLHLSVSWPLTIVLTQANLETYNKIFLFLAEVKRSLWALQTVSLADLDALEDRMEGAESLSLSCLASDHTLDTSLCLGAKQHRLQLLRAWLLYFTSTIHGYFMSRVVHTTELELRENLTAATDLDMILDTHNRYLQRIYDRCFLHPSVTMLRDAVVMVLNIGLELKAAVNSGLPIHSRTVVGWEEKYSKCHNFLAKTLQSMTNRRKVPHLEGLTTALLHSCPA